MAELVLEVVAWKDSVKAKFDSDIDQSETSLAVSPDRSDSSSRSFRLTINNPSIFSLLLEEQQLWRKATSALLSQICFS